MAPLLLTVCKKTEGGRKGVVIRLFPRTGDYWYVPDGLPSGRDEVCRGWMSYTYLHKVWRRHRAAKIIQQTWRRVRSPIAVARAARIAADDRLWDHVSDGGHLALPWELVEKVLECRMRVHTLNIIRRRNLVGDETGANHKTILVAREDSEDCDDDFYREYCMMRIGPGYLHPE
jgi:hypothetical protein